mgnify:CR=1 FL=1
MTSTGIVVTASSSAGLATLQAGGLGEREEQPASGAGAELMLTDWSVLGKNHRRSATAPGLGPTRPPIMEFQSVPPFWEAPSRLEREAWPPI